MKIQKPYTKVGRIKLSIARKAKIKCADIVIDEAHINHIQQKHNAELVKLGMSAFYYVKFIVDNYNQIYRNADKSVLLVVDYTKQIADTCCMQLHFINGWWEIKTAQPRRKITGELICSTKKSGQRTTYKKPKS